MRVFVFFFPLILKLVFRFNIYMYSFTFGFYPYNEICLCFLPVFSHYPSISPFSYLLKSVVLGQIENLGHKIRHFEQVQTSLESTLDSSADALVRAENRAEAETLRCSHLRDTMKNFIAKKSCLLLFLEEYRREMLSDHFLGSFREILQDYRSEMERTTNSLFSVFLHLQNSVTSRESDLECAKREIRVLRESVIIYILFNPIFFGSGCFLNDSFTLNLECRIRNFFFFPFFYRFPRLILNSWTGRLEKRKYVLGSKEKASVKL